MNEPGKQKPEWGLLPWDSLPEVVKVMEYGARKYSREGWRAIPNAEQEYANACQRHLARYWQGEPLDLETGIHHLAHVAADALIALAVALSEGSLSKTHSEQTHSAPESTPLESPDSGPSPHPSSAVAAHTDRGIALSVAVLSAQRHLASALGEPSKKDVRAILLAELLSDSETEPTPDAGS